MRIAFTINGSRNTKVKVKNLSTHKLLDLCSGYVNKVMTVKYNGKLVQEEIREHLTDKQLDAVLTEAKRRVWPEMHV